MKNKLIHASVFGVIATSCVNYLKISDKTLNLHNNEVKERKNTAINHDDKASTLCTDEDIEKVSIDKLFKSNILLSLGEGKFGTNFG